MSIPDRLQAALDAVSENAGMIPLADWAALERAIRELRVQRDDAVRQLQSLQPWLGHASDLLVRDAESLFNGNTVDGKFDDPYVEAEYSLLLAVVAVLMDVQGDQPEAAVTKPLFQKQKFQHRPEEGTFGDCHRTCIASLLGKDRDDVPHWGVHYNDIEQFAREANAYLASQGLRALTFAVWGESPQQALDWMAKFNPGVYYMLTGKSRNGTNHVVICKDSEIVWDPAIDNSGIIDGCIGDEDATNWYWVEILVPNARSRQ